MFLYFGWASSPADFALRRSSRMSTGFCAFLQPHSNARDAFLEPIQYSPPRLLGRELSTKPGSRYRIDKKLLTWEPWSVLLVSSVHNRWSC